MTWDQIKDELGQETLSIILGSLLGDGYMSFNKKSGSKNARFRFKHSVAQKDYFIWKAEKIAKISGKKPYKEYGRENDLGAYAKTRYLQYNSRSLPVLTAIYEKTYFPVDGVYKIKLDPSWMKFIEPQGLSIYWCDDGSLMNGVSGIFAADGFSIDCIKCLQETLKDSWGVETNLVEWKRAGKHHKMENDRFSYRLQIKNKENLVKFLKLILPGIPVSAMLYKAGLLYKTEKNQESWIRIMSEKTSFDEDLIRKLLKERRETLRRFN